MPHPQNLDLRFARACTVEMHMDMSQEQFCARILRETASPQDEGKLAGGADFARACTVEMHMDISQAHKLSKEV